MPTTDLRPGPHRQAEAGTRRSRTVHSDKERAVPRRRIPRIGEPAVTKHVILDSDGRQLTSPNSDERVPGRWRGFVNSEPAGCRPRRRPQPVSRRRQVAPRRLRPHGVAEQGVVVASAKAVDPGLLLVGPASRHVSGGSHLIERDRSVTDGRAYDRVPPCDEDTEQGIEACRADDDRVEMLRAGQSRKRILSVVVALVLMRRRCSARSRGNSSTVRCDCSSWTKTITVGFNTPVTSWSLTGSKSSYRSPTEPNSSVAARQTTPAATVRNSATTSAGNPQRRDTLPTDRLQALTGPG